jgi:hypothetical protein
MDATQRTALLSSVREDIDRCEQRIQGFRQVIVHLEREMAELRRVEAYLNRGPIPQFAVETSVAEPAPLPSPAETLTPEAIITFAVDLLRRLGPNRPLRALDIARELVTHYDPEEDRRMLENRIYSFLKRRPDTFVRTERGLWTLKEFTENGPPSDLRKATYDGTCAEDEG